MSESLMEHLFFLVEIGASGFYNTTLLKCYGEMLHTIHAKKKWKIHLAQQTFQQFQNDVTDTKVSTQTEARLN